MATRLPPLNPLRTFEVAARHLSFTRAARELHVTPGAVSRQVMVLEEFLGARLFERVNREVRLTAVGRRYLDDLNDVFDSIGEATQRAMQGVRDKPLHIWCPMTFAMRWLVPRLPAFHGAHPGRDAIFTTSLKPVDFTEHDADVAIRMGRGDWPGVISRFLVGIDLLPVCSPRLLEGRAPLAHPRDLAQHTLLQSVARPDYWPTWLKAAGASDIDPDRGLTFESVSLAYQAALEGLGVAMGQHALVAEDLAAGRLVAPFGLRVPIDNAFYLIYPERLQYDTHLCTFRDWILAEAQADETRRAAPRT
ncbi:MAG: transcriptional regulator GcvA [Alcaligenaceae bacterium]|nr:transcriptional regulator GcvA [Alcaligenaceae bacterium SAGV5]MPS54328.1 transcriptional regulator GcvA [Alcaligenaceae bacterium SAGV3]MPT55262.1 transcriptional regulator GcvA [Alcaligenaceae bacterium]